MKVLVTGSNGFIGKHLATRLRFDGHDVYEYDTSIHRENEYRGNTYDIIYHLGAISSTQEQNKDKIYKYNVQAVVDLIEFARKHEIFVSFASSASVYGSNRNTPFKLTDDLRPESEYAKSKVIGEMLLGASGLSHNCLRFFNVYSTDGISENHKGSQASPYHTFSKQKFIEVFEGSEAIKRDFIHVDELINNIIDKSYIAGIFNCGTGNPKSFMDVAKEVSEITNAPIKIIPFPQKLKQNYQHYTCAG